MAGKKAQRIAELERELAGVTAERDALRSTAAAYQRRVRTLEAQRKPSLADAAKREVHDRWDWLLDALGLPS